MKVLLIEDEESYRAILGKMLKPHVEMVYACTLNEAFECLCKERFDCVLTDPNLPDSLPTETVKSIMDRNPEANVIVISGSTDPATISAAVKAGAHAYLVKGKDDLRTEDLLRVIRDAQINRGILNG